MFATKGTRAGAQRLLTVVLAATLLTRAVAGIAAGDEDAPRARVLFEQGLRHIEDGDHPAAARAFEQSLALFPSPSAAYNLAVALRKGGAPARARAVLRALLDGEHGPLASAQRREASAFLTELAAEVAAVVVEVSPASAAASVALDGGAPLPLAGGRTRLELDPGRHGLRITAPDFVPVERRFEVVPAQELSAYFSLQPATAAPPSGLSIGEDAQVKTPAKSDHGASPSWLGRHWLWVGLGVVAAGVVVGALTLRTTRVDRVDDPVFMDIETLTVR